MDETTQELIENTYHETVAETFSRGGSSLDAHKEGVVAAAMLLSAMTGLEDEDAKKQVVGLNLRPS